MFTLKQINEIHDRAGNEETLGLYLRELRAIGVDTYDSYITDGHSVYIGEDGQQLESPPAHERFEVAETSDREAFLAHMSLVEQGKLGYVEMSRAFAGSGVEKWTFDTQKMTLTYYGIDGMVMLAEEIA
jgi:uncharacterized protein YbcV (DUF1398 family)